MTNRNIYGLDQSEYRKLYTAFRDQNRRCYDERSKAFKYYGANGVRVEYTLDELVRWFKDQKTIENWSIGRIDHSLNYNLSNIELVSRSQNSSERINRVGTPKPRRSILAFKDGSLVGKFESAKLAAKSLGCHHSHLLEVVNGKAKTHHGYVFMAEV